MVIAFLNFRKGDGHMRFLITGGLGHIGSKLIRELAVYPHTQHICVLDNFSSQRYNSLFHLPKGNYEFIEGDVLDENILIKAMENVDVVIHLAAITDAPSTFANPALVKQVNEFGTQKVVDMAIQKGVKRFIYPSTTSVYGPTEGIAREDCSEEDLKPQSPYAETKLAGEKITLNAYQNYGLPSTVFRLGTIFGPSPGMRFHTAINKFIFLACTNKPLTVWDSAVHLKRPYLDLRDAVKSFLFALEHRETIGETFNVVTLNAGIGEITDAIKRYVPNLQIAYTKNPLLNQMSYFTDDTKIKNLGFTYLGNLDEGVKETIHYLRGLL